MLGAGGRGRLIAVNTAASARAHSGCMNAPPAPRPKALRRRGAARVIPEAPAPAGGDDDAAFVEHPDGWYWLAPDGQQQFGPFADRQTARAERDRYSEEAPAEGETVQEAEHEIGMGDWIDAETGAPAEGQSPPHLEEP